MPSDGISNKTPHFVLHMSDVGRQSWTPIRTPHKIHLILSPSSPLLKWQTEQILRYLAAPLSAFSSCLDDGVNGHDRSIETSENERETAKREMKNKQQLLTDNDRNRWSGKLRTLHTTVSCNLENQRLKVGQKISVLTRNNLQYLTFSVSSRERWILKLYSVIQMRIFALTHQ